MREATVPEAESGIPQRYEKRLKQALAHQIRVDLMRVVEERPSSMRELAEMFDETLSGIAAHVLELWKEGSVEVEDDDSVLLADRRVHITRVDLDDVRWQELSPDERYEATVRVLEGFIGEAMAALRSGHLISRADGHQTWIPVTVDEQGWTETMKILDRAFEEVKAVKQRCAERLEESGRPGISTIVSIMGFERGDPPVS
jgi:DNA-binding MarR family transcriptional regulator